MPTKLSRYKQSIFDIVAENFGTLDYIVKVANENGLSISDNLPAGTSLEINSKNLGEADIKETIINKGYTFNNNVDDIDYLTADTTLFTADSTMITADQTIWPS